MRAVTNAGPLIHLSWIDQLHLLPSLFDELLVPEAVRDEVLHVADDVPGAAGLRAAFAAGWPVVHAVTDRAAVEALTVALDRGEAEALVLMHELRADLILLDERRARAHAVAHAFPMTGTLGVLRRARERGLVPAALPLLSSLRERGFRISTALVEQVAREEAAGPGA